MKKKIMLHYKIKTKSKGIGESLLLYTFCLINICLTLVMTPIK